MNAKQERNVYVVVLSKGIPPVISLWVKIHTPFMWQTEVKHGTNQELEQYCTACQIHYTCCTDN